MEEIREEGDPVARGTSRRLLSLDLLRGLTVIGMIVVNSAAGLASRGEVFPTLRVPSTQRLLRGPSRISSISRPRP